MRDTSTSFLPAADPGYDPSSQPGFAFSMSRELRDGDAGIEQTIKLVRDCVWQSLSDPWMRMQAARLLQAAPAVQAYDEPAKAYRFWRKVYEGITFVDHPIAHQLVQSPQFTINSRIGNCTDINAVLLSSLLMNVGIPVHLVTVANNPNHPEEFNHVYIEAQLDGEWLPIDAARPDASFGTTVPNVFRSRVWDLLSADYFERRGLNGAYLGSQDGEMQRLGEGFDWNGLITNLTNATGTIIGKIREPIQGYYRPQPLPQTRFFQGGEVSSGTPGGTPDNSILLYGALGLAGVALVMSGKK